MRKVVLFARDLGMAAAIDEVGKSSGLEIIRVRDIESFKGEIDKKPEYCVINLGIAGEEPFEAAKYSLANSVTTIGFLPHVMEQLITRAQGLGMEHIYPRSQIIKRLIAMWAGG